MDKHRPYVPIDRHHEKHGKNADDNTDGSKNEPSAIPSAIPSAEKHGKTTSADNMDDTDDKFINNSGKVTEALEEERTCGQCALWHKGGCCFPGDPNCITPTNAYAVDCHSFIHGMQKEWRAGSVASNAEPDSTRIISNEDSKPKVEMKPETDQKADSSQNLDNSEGLAHE